MSTTAPDLWPDMNRSTPTAKAWITIWNMLDAERWTPLADVIDAASRAHPELERKTIDMRIRDARHRKFVQRKGGYSHKTGRDTRMIRRHPATQETAAP